MEGSESRFWVGDVGDGGIERTSQEGGVENRPRGVVDGENA